MDWLWLCLNLEVPVFFFWKDNVLISYCVYVSEVDGNILDITLQLLSWFDIINAYSIITLHDKLSEQSVKCFVKLICSQHEVVWMVVCRQ